MGLIEERLAERGLTLPPAPVTPPGMVLPFPWVRVRGDRAFVSGHGPRRPDGTIVRSLGRVGAGCSPDDAREAARLTALAILGSLSRELGALDRVTAWLRVLVMVNAAPGFTATPGVANGFTDLVLDLWGPEAGAHARSAIGVAELPLGMPVEIEAEVEVRPSP